MEVLGLGFSDVEVLSAALEILQFPTYNIMTVLDRRDENFWLTKIPKTKTYSKTNEKPKISDFKGTFLDYQATVGFPATSFSSEIIEHFPNAKVIITVKDTKIEEAEELAKEYKAISNLTLLSPFRIFLSFAFAGVFYHKLKILYFANRVIFSQFFRSKGEEIGEEVIYYRSQKNIKEIEKLVPKERILFYNIKDGWAPLCKFLSVPIPSFPFPPTPIRKYNPLIKKKNRMYQMLSIPFVTLIGYLIYTQVDFSFRFRGLIADFFTPPFYVDNIVASQ